MGDAISLFVAGLGGVFAGMALLYAAIRVTASITERFFRDSDPGAGKND